MSKNLIALAASLLLAGCTASANVSAGAGTSTSPAPGASAAPATGAVAGYYAVGRKWVYDLTSVTAGQTQKSTQSWECTAVNGDTATIKLTMTTAAGETSSTTNVKMDQTLSSNGQSLPAGTTITDQGTESVTTAAGTFNAHKFMSTTSDANADTTNTQWVDSTVGLVKMISNIKPKMAAVPGMDLSTTMTMELKSFTK